MKRFRFMNRSYTRAMQTCKLRRAGDALPTRRQRSQQRYSQSIMRCSIPAYASIRRSRRNGQCVRCSSTRFHSISADDDFFPSTLPLAMISPLGRDDETLAPEFDPIAAGRRFVADAIRRRDVTTIRDRVAALHRFPRGMLRRAVFFFLAPDASRSRSDKTKSPRRATRSGAPLPDTIGPSKRRRRFSRARLPALKTEIARREIKLLVDKSGSSGMCILRYFPRSFPSASMIAAVL